MWASFMPLILRGGGGLASGGEPPASQCVLAWHFGVFWFLFYAPVGGDRGCSGFWGIGAGLEQGIAEGNGNGRAMDGKENESVGSSENGKHSFEKLLMEQNILGLCVSILNLPTRLGCRIAVSRLGGPHGRNQTSSHILTSRAAINEANQMLRLLRISQHASKILQASVSQGGALVAAHLKDHLEVLLWHLGTEVKVAGTILEVIGQSEDLLLQLEDDQLEAFAQVAANMQHERFVRLLQALCRMPTGVPIVANQRRVLRVFFMKRAKFAMPIIRIFNPSFGSRTTKVKGPASMVFPDRTEISMHDCRSYSDVDPENHHQMHCLQLYDYFLAVLKLAADVCAGRHAEALDFLICQDKWGMRYHDMTALLNDNLVPVAVRRALVRLVLVLYVDREPRTQVPLVSFTRAITPSTFNSIHKKGTIGQRLGILKADKAESSGAAADDEAEGAQPQPPSSAKETFSRLAGSCLQNGTGTSAKAGAASGEKVEKVVSDPFVDVARVFQLDFKNMKGEPAHDPFMSLPHRRPPDDFPEVVAWALSVLSAACEADHDMLSQPTRNTIDGASKELSLECPELLVKDAVVVMEMMLHYGILSLAPKRLANAADARSVQMQQETLHSICKLLTLVFDIRLEMRLTRLHSSFEEQCRHFFRYTETANISASQQVLEDLEQALFKTNLLSSKVSGEGGRELQEGLLSLCTSSVPSNNLDTGVMVHTLTERDLLQLEVFKLLFRHVSQVANFVSSAQMVHLNVTAIESQLHQVIFLMNRDLKKLEGLCAREDDPEAFTTATEILHTLISLCNPPAQSKESGHTPKRLRQWVKQMLKNSSMHMTVLSILDLPLAIEGQKAVLVSETSVTMSPTEARRDNENIGLRYAQNKAMAVLFDKCYQWLACFCRDSPQNQEVVFPYIPQFLRHVGVDGINAASAVAACFTDNRNLGVQVKEEILRFFIHAVVRYGKKARWLKIMEPFVIMCGTPVERNQEIVMRLLMEERDAVLELDGAQGGEGLETEGEQDRETLMEQWTLDSYAAGDTFLAYHVECIHLLALCANGHLPNKFKCRDLISFTAALSNILDIELHSQTGRLLEKVDHTTFNFIRRPFMHFLTEVYIATDDDAAKQMVGDAASNRWWGDPSVVLGNNAALLATQSGQLPFSRVRLGMVQHIAAEVIALKEMLVSQQRQEQQQNKVQLSAQAEEDRKTALTIQTSYVLHDAMRVVVSFFQYQWKANTVQENLQAHVTAALADLSDAVLSFISVPKVKEMIVELGFPCSIGGPNIFTNVIRLINELRRFGCIPHAKVLKDHTGADLMAVLSAGEQRNNSEVLESDAVINWGTNVSAVANVAKAVRALTELTVRPMAHQTSILSAEERVRNAWVPFLQKLAAQLGVLDTTRMIGPGMNRLAKILAGSDADSQCDAVCHILALPPVHALKYGNAPSVKYRNVVLFGLRSLRASVYLQAADPDEASQMQAFERFMRGNDPEATPDQLRDASERHCRLGAAQVVLTALCNPDEEVALAGGRYGVSLLTFTQSVECNEEKDVDAITEMQSDTVEEAGLSKMQEAMMSALVHNPLEAVAGPVRLRSMGHKLVSTCLRVLEAAGMMHSLHNSSSGEAESEASLGRPGGDIESASQKHQEGDGSLLVQLITEMFDLLTRMSRNSPVMKALIVQFLLSEILNFVKVMEQTMFSYLNSHKLIAVKHFLLVMGLLIEVVKGNQHAAVIIAEGPLLELLQRILSKAVYDSFYDRIKGAVKLSVLKLMLALLEGSSVSQQSSIITRVKSSMQWRVFATHWAATANLLQMTARGMQQTSTASAASCCPAPSVPVSQHLGDDGRHDLNELPPEAGMDVVKGLLELQLKVEQESWGVGKGMRMRESGDPQGIGESLESVDNAVSTENLFEEIITFCIITRILLGNPDVTVNTAAGLSNKWLVKCIEMAVGMKEMVASVQIVRGSNLEHLHFRVPACCQRMKLDFEHVRRLRELIFYRNIYAEQERCTTQQSQLKLLELLQMGVHSIVRDQVISLSSRLVAARRNQSRKRRLALVLAITLNALYMAGFSERSARLAASEDLADPSTEAMDLSANAAAAADFPSHLRTWAMAGGMDVQEGREVLEAVLGHVLGAVHQFFLEYSDRMANTVAILHFVISLDRYHNDVLMAVPTETIYKLNSMSVKAAADATEKFHKGKLIGSWMLAFFDTSLTTLYTWEGLLSVLYLFCSFMGCMYCHLWFAFHLADLTVGSPTMRLLFLSISLNIGKLGQAALLGMLIIYAHAIFGYLVMREEHASGKCSDIAECAMSYMQHGIRGEGISESLEDQQNFLSLRTLLETSFQVMIVMVLLSIISGIIIDSFGELRDRVTQNLDRVANTCSLCGDDRQTVELKTHKSFEHHLFEVHSLWHLLDLMVYLDLKHSLNTLTAQETFVLTCLMNKSTSFLPKETFAEADGPLIEDSEALTVTSNVETSTHLKKLDLRMQLLESGLQDIATMLMKHQMQQSQRDAKDNTTALRNWTTARRGVSMRSLYSGGSTLMKRVSRVIADETNAESESKSNLAPRPSARSSLSSNFGGEASVKPEGPQAKAGSHAVGRLRRRSQHETASSAVAAVTRVECTVREALQKGLLQVPSGAQQEQGAAEEASAAAEAAPLPNSAFNAAFEAEEPDRYADMEEEPMLDETMSEQSDVELAVPKPEPEPEPVGLGAMSQEPSSVTAGARTSPHRGHAHTHSLSMEMLTPSSQEGEKAGNPRSPQHQRSPSNPPMLSSASASKGSSPARPDLEETAHTTAPAQSGAGACATLRQLPMPKCEGSLYLLSASLASWVYCRAAPGTQWVHVARRTTESTKGAQQAGTLPVTRAFERFPSRRKDGQEEAQEARTPSWAAALESSDEEEFPTTPASGNGRAPLRIHTSSQGLETPPKSAVSGGGGSAKTPLTGRRVETPAKNAEPGEDSGARPSPFTPREADTRPRSVSRPRESESRESISAYGSASSRSSSMDSVADSMERAYDVLSSGKKADRSPRGSRASTRAASPTSVTSSKRSAGSEVNRFTTATGIHVQKLHSDSDDQDDDDDDGDDDDDDNQTARDDVSISSRGSGSVASMSSQQQKDDASGTSESRYSRMLRRRQFKSMMRLKRACTMAASNVLDSDEDEDENMNLDTYDYNDNEVGEDKPKTIHPSVGMFIS
ncbi:hypothetical protein CYMTET_51330 [Cymbomonas tetramitiformis]|uniref:RIH domain-containing protein n=1 Tax=Cymbomonas tetramitiformis TaxID=36881 RepID=A0AAE0ETT8_9CHLO|nr:hypothetical protein CYMTET_51330 [Cymbomonas tetramitiformis]